MITLGLDPSLTGFGWAIHDSTATGGGRVVAKGIFPTAASWVFVRRYMFLRDAVVDLLTSHPEVENVGAESPPFHCHWSEGLYALSVYVTEAVMSSRRDLVFFDPSTVKMLVRGDSRVRKGRIDKLDVIEACRVDTGVSKWNHNEADAYVIGRSAAHFWEYLEGRLVESELTPSEAQAFLGKVAKGRRAGGLASKEGTRFFRFSR